MMWCGVLGVAERRSGDEAGGGFNKKKKKSRRRRLEDGTHEGSEID
jgi:hypothetical protein